MSPVSAEKSASSAKASWMPIFRRMAPRSYVAEMENFGTNKSIYLWGNEERTYVYQHIKLMFPSFSLPLYYIGFCSPPVLTTIAMQVIAPKPSEVIPAGKSSGSVNAELQHWKERHVTHL